MSLRDHWHFLKLVDYSLNDMRLNHVSPRALPVLYNCSFLFWDRATLVHVDTCMHLRFEWSRDSAMVVQILHTSLSRVSNVAICGYSFKIWTGVVSPPRRASAFINPQPDLAGIEYWSNYEPQYLYPKYNSARAVWKRVTGLLCDWEWLQNFSANLTTFLDLKKAVPDLFFFFSFNR